MGPGQLSPGAQLSTFSGWTIGPQTVGPWGRNPPTDIYPPIVGRIYPIPVYKFNGHVFPKCWQLISNMNIKKVCYGTLRPKGAHSPFDVQFILNYIPKMLAVYIQYKFVFQNVQYPTLRPKGSQKPSN